MGVQRSRERVDALAVSSRRRLCRALSESQRGKIGELVRKMIRQGNLFAGWSVAYRSFVGPTESPASGQFSAVWMYGKLSEEDKREVDALAASGRRRLSDVLSKSQCRLIGQLFKKKLERQDSTSDLYVRGVPRYIRITYKMILAIEGYTPQQRSAIWMHGKLSEEDQQEVNTLEASGRRRLCPKLSERQRSMIGELFAEMRSQRDLQEAGWDICHYHKPFVGPNKVAGSDWQQFSANWM